MPSIRFAPVSIVIVMGVLPLAAQNGGVRGRGGAAGAPGPAGPPMTMTIAGFPDGGQIPVKFSQAAPGVAPGEGMSPAITWTTPPAGTQSFPLNMHDMDVSRNKTTDDQAHWVVWNIPSASTGLPEGVAKGSQLPDGSYQIKCDRSDVPGAGRSGERSAASLCIRAFRDRYKAGRQTNLRRPPDP